MRKSRTTSRPKIPLDVRLALWGRAGGHCEFHACPKPVYCHSCTKQQANLAQLAHIIGFSSKGPRGEEELSHKLAKDISNLMLLCGDCHKLIDDQEYKSEYGVGLLRNMKRLHESRVKLAASIVDANQTLVVTYSANINGDPISISRSDTSRALFPKWYPLDETPLELGNNSRSGEGLRHFWDWEMAQIRDGIDTQVKSRLRSGTAEHLSLFAIAPQPLLIYLGSLLQEAIPAEVYQLHRGPTGWGWPRSTPSGSLIVERPAKKGRPPALVLALSATVDATRIRSILPKSSIYCVTTPSPNKDFLKTRNQLAEFKELVRALLDEIRAAHGTGAVLSVFPVAPVAACVELGRVLSPKAKMVMDVYDELPRQGFVKALRIE